MAHFLMCLLHFLGRSTTILIHLLHCLSGFPAVWPYSHHLILLTPGFFKENNGMIIRATSQHRDGKGAAETPWTCSADDVVEKSGQESWFWSQTVWMYLLANCYLLGELLNISEPRYSCLQNAAINANLMELCKLTNERMGKLNPSVWHRRSNK